MYQEVKYQNQYHNDSDSSEQEARAGQKHNQGAWLEEEVLKFMIFAHFNSNILASRLQRRTNKIFKQMAKFIGTRSSMQCRSQNQKLIKKHKNNKRIIKAFEQQFGKKEFEQACIQHQNQLRTIKIARKKLKLMRNLQILSKSTQTDFPDDSSSQEKHYVKIQQELHPQQDLPPMHFTTLPVFPTSEREGFLRNSTQ